MLIEKGLNNNDSFSAIGKLIGKDPSTISKEVRRHISYHVKFDMNDKIPCAKRPGCGVMNLCIQNCHVLCKQCMRPDFRCTTVCRHYEERTCKRLKKPPYVCNGCVQRSGCLMRRSFYSAQHAQDTYANLKVDAREGINQSPVDIYMLDQLVSPLLKKGQSLAHIYAHHAAEIPVSRRTLYNYIDKGLFEARNIDMRRRVKYKVRKKPTRVSILAREFRIGRTYEDYLKFIKGHPEIPVVQMDTVEGPKKGGGKVFLTLFFLNCSLMLLFLLEDKSQASVTSVFDWLTQRLGVETFQALFKVILTDNGTEFQYPERLECDGHGEIRTKIFYCNPNSSWQKGMLEKNHGYIRLVLPKGKSFDEVTQEKTTLLMNHINSEARDSLNGCTPYKLSLLLLDHKLHSVLNLKEIPPDDVSLMPSLLK